MESPRTTVTAPGRARRAGRIRRVPWFAVAVPALALAAPGAQAATIRVTTSADSAALPGVCSLRAAIIAANSDAAVGGCPAGSGIDAITLPPATYDLTIAGLDEDAGLTGDLDATSSMRIVAREGAVIDAGATGDRVLDVHAPAVVLLDGVTVQHGATATNGPPEESRGGGGIFNSGTLTLVHTIVQSNAADGGAEPFGGGIFNSGKLTLLHSVVQADEAVAGGGVASNGELTVRDSRVVNNRSQNFDGGIGSRGTLRLLSSTVANNTTSRLEGTSGGIGSYGPLVVRNSHIIRNFPGGIRVSSSSISTMTGSTVAFNHLGGIYIDPWGVMTISRSAIHDNHTRGSGGGIFNRGQLRVERSAVFANLAYGSTDGQRGDPDGPAFGGGIYNEGALRVINSSVFANQAIVGACLDMTCYSGSGGGIASVTPAGAAAPATLVVAASTISQNAVVARAPSDPAPVVSGGGIGLVDSTAQVRGALVADNTAPVAADCAGSLQVLDWSLLGDARGCAWSSGSGDLIGVDPLLGATTPEQPVVPLQPGSPAIDAGPPRTGRSCPRSDQRGVARPQDGDGDGIARCDIGAYELIAGAS